MEVANKAKSIIWSSFFEFARIACAYLLQIIIAHRFGLSATLDSYFAAYAIIYFIYRIVGNVIGPIIIPLMSKGDAVKKGRSDALICSIANTFLLIVIFVCLLGTFFATDIMAIAAPGLTLEYKALSAEILMIIIWVALIGGVITLASSLLQYYQHFILNAASALLQYAIMIPFVLLAKNLGIFALAIGLLLGFLFQLAAQILILKKDLFKYHLSFKIPDEKRREVTDLAYPLLLTGLVLNSISIVDNFFASSLPAGSISSLSYAYKLLSLVMVASGVVSVVYFTPISKLAAKGDDKGVRDNFIRAFRISAFIAIPGLIGFSFFGRKLLQLLLQGGKFSGDDVSAVSLIIIIFAGAGAVWSMWGVGIKLFYAYHRTGIPLLCFSLVSLLNVLFNWLLMKYMGVYGLALASTIAYVAGFVLMIFFIVRSYGKEMFAGIPKFCIKMLTASFTACLTGYVMLNWYETMYGFNTKWIMLPVMLVIGSICFFIFNEIAREMNIPELKEFFSRYLPLKCFRRYTDFKEVKNV